MTVRISELNEMSEQRASDLLAQCCGASRWVAGMVARRPFGSRGDAFVAADESWQSLRESDWLEAFAHHPRIGERTAAVAQGARGAAWSLGEQSEVSRAREDVRGQLDRVNQEYEAHFGYIYIVCATGKTAKEMLAIARARMANDPAVEIRVAAEEQRKILQLRLDRLLDNTETM